MEAPRYLYLTSNRCDSVSSSRVIPPWYCIRLQSSTLCLRPPFAVAQHLPWRFIPRHPGSHELYFLQDSQRKVIYQVNTIPSVQQRTAARTTCKAVRHSNIQTLTKNYQVRNYKITKSEHNTYIITASVHETADKIPHWIYCRTISASVPDGRKDSPLDNL